MNWFKSVCISVLLMAVACNHLPQIGGGSANNIYGFYVLNQGNEGNNSTLDYYEYSTGIYSKDIFTERNPYVNVTLDGGCNDMAVCGDSLYVISDSWNYFFQIHDFKYSIVDVRTHEVLTSNFIAYGTDEQIQNPSAIAVNPQTREILIADSGDGVTPGKLYCFSKEGILQWSLRTGVNPVRIVFTRTPLL